MVSQNMLFFVVVVVACFFCACALKLTRVLVSWYNHDVAMKNFSAVDTLMMLYAPE